MNSAAVRHQLMEGVLRRLAGRPNAGGLVLRGGMLLQQWFRPTPRAVLDLDLVAPAPLSADANSDAAGFRDLFANTINDDVVFDQDQIDMEGIWLQSAHPGVRLHVRGTVDGHQDELQVDITGGPWPVPEPVMGDLHTASGPIRLWMCRPESIAAQKLQALWHLGVHGWRAKDLDDLHQLLERVPLDQARLSQAIDASFAELHGTAADARNVFGPSSWWHMKHAAARWSDYLSQTNDSRRRLPDVAATVAAQLSPSLQELT